MYDFGDIDWRVKLDKERLRSECSDKLSALTLEDREITSIFNNTDLPAEKIFSLYNSKTKNSLYDIESESVASETRNCLTKTMKLNYPKSEEMFSLLVETRREQILDDFIGSLGISGECEIDDFSAEEFSALIARFCDYKHSQEIAERYDLTLLDKNSSKRNQWKARRKIKKERKNDIKNDAKQLRNTILGIADLIYSDSTFESITNNQLDTITILGLRQDWQRELSSVEPTSLKTKQVFDSVTRKYIESVIKTYSETNPDKPLQDLKAFESNITEIILTVFNADNADCNNLIHLAYEYKKLLVQKDELELAIKNRDDFLNK